jgi:hypothetical protein
MPGVVNPWTTDIHNSFARAIGGLAANCSFEGWLFQYPIRWLAPLAEDVSASGLKDRRLYLNVTL